LKNDEFPFFFSFSFHFPTKEMEMKKERRVPEWVFKGISTVCSPLVGEADGFDEIHAGAAARIEDDDVLAGKGGPAASGQLSASRERWASTPAPRARACEGSGTEQEILMCVVTRLEIGKVKSIALEHDPGAFIMFHPLSDVSGGVHRKRLGV